RAIRVLIKIGADIGILVDVRELNAVLSTLLTEEREGTKGENSQKAKQTHIRSFEAGILVVVPNSEYYYEMMVAPVSTSDQLTDPRNNRSPLRIFSSQLPKRWSSRAMHSRM